MREVRGRKVDPTQNTATVDYITTVRYGQILQPGSPHNNLIAKTLYCHLLEKLHLPTGTTEKPDTGLKYCLKQTAIVLFLSVPVISRSVADQGSENAKAHLVEMHHSKMDVWVFPLRRGLNLTGVIISHHLPNTIPRSKFNWMDHVRGKKIISMSSLEGRRGSANCYRW